MCLVCQNALENGLTPPSTLLHGPNGLADADANLVVGYTPPNPLPNYSDAQIVQALRTSWLGTADTNGDFPRDTRTFDWSGGTIWYQLVTTQTVVTNGTGNSSTTTTRDNMSAHEQSRIGIAFEIWDDFIAFNITNDQLAGTPGHSASFMTAFYVSGGTMSADGTQNGNSSGRAFANYTSLTNRADPNVYGTTSVQVNNAVLSLGRSFNNGEFDGRVGNGGTADSGVDDLAYGQRGFETILHEIGHALGLSHPGFYNNGSVTQANGQLFAQDTLRNTIMSYNSEVAFNTDGVNTVNYQGINASTPMVYDILAIQAIYGADLTTRTGNDTYGFNNNTGRAAYSFSFSQGSVFTIYDAGGNDTLDASFFDSDSVINLNPGAYSSIGERDSSSGPAMLQNIGIAFGTIIENAVGGSGNDWIIGNGANNVLSGWAGYDVLEGYDGADILDPGRDTAGSASYGGNGVDYIYATGGADWIDGGTNYDLVDYSRSEQGVVIDLSIGKIAGGDAWNDTLIDIEYITGSNDGDQVRMLGGQNVIRALGGSDFVDGGAGDDFLYGGSGDDTLIGGQGVDFVDGASGFDIAQFYAAVTINLASGVHGGEAAGDTFSSIEQYIGSAQGDAMYAGAAGARFAGGDGQDWLVGGGGEDWLQGGKMEDYLDGGAGFDMASYADAPNAITVDMSQQIGTTWGQTDGKVIAGEWGMDTLVSIEDIEGTAFHDYFIGDERDNQFIGLGGNDRFEGGAGADIFKGGDGDDTAQLEMGDYFEGGNGYDTATFAGGAIDLNFQNGQFYVGGWTIFNILSVEYIVGTGAADIVTGSNLGEAINLGDANDTMYGMGGDDVLYTSAGADWMDGGDGRDTMAFHKAMVADWQSGVLDADIGVDSWLNWEIIRGSGGDDRIRTNDWGYAIELQGGAGNDVLATGPNGDTADTLRGDEGSDRLSGGAGNDALYGGDGDDFLDIGAGADLMDGGAGKDTIVFTSSITADWQNGVLDALIATDSYANWEVLQGADGVDIIRTNDWGYAIELRGGGGNDVLSTGSADGDGVFGEAGDDRINAGAGNDTVGGGQGADWIFGGAGIDIVTYALDAAGAFVQLAWGWARDGFGTEDILDASIENIEGTGFNDVLIGWNGATLIYGGAGADWIEDVGTGADALYGQGGNDIVFGGADNDALFGEDGDDALLGGAGNDALDGGAGTDWIYAGAGADTVLGGDGNDVLFGGEGGGPSDGNDNIQGGAGNDALMGEQGDDVMNGDDGVDWIYGGAGKDTIAGGAGDDVLIGGDGGAGADGDDIIDGLSGNDALIGQAGNDEMDAGQGDDWAYGGEGNDLIDGGDGNDVLAGENGDDTIYGGAGNDYLFGSYGNDILYGGAGNDWIEGSFGGSVITGGAGADSLFGGDNARFVYNATSESTEAAADVIGIFWRPGGDRIDVRTIDADGNAGNGDTAFTFVSAFTNVAGQAVISASGADSIARFDTNGDGVSDMTIVVLGVQLIAADFMA